jgi:uncharacterized protein involved in type VI secretion and phage assembly
MHLLAAQIIETTDPGRSGRVQVRLVESEGEPLWARLLLPFSRPQVCIPEVGDEVIVAFMNEESRDAIVLGRLWNGS